MIISRRMMSNSQLSLSCVSVRLNLRRKMLLRATDRAMEDPSQVLHRNSRYDFRLSEPSWAADFLVDSGLTSLRDPDGPWSAQRDSIRSVFRQLFSVVGRVRRGLMGRTGWRSPLRCCWSSGCWLQALSHSEPLSREQRAPQVRLASLVKGMDGCCSWGRCLRCRCCRIYLKICTAKREK